LPSGSEELGIGRLLRGQLVDREQGEDCSRAVRTPRSRRCRTSIVETVPLPPLATKAVLLFGVTAGAVGNEPTAMSLGSLVRVFTSIVETVPLSLLVTKRVVPSGVTLGPTGAMPTAISVGSLVLVFTSIADTVLLPALATKAVGRHRARPGTADTLPGTTPTSAPANPNTNTTRTHRDRRIAALPVTGDKV
jgi:hypothetical protein